MKSKRIYVAFVVALLLAVASGLVVYAANISLSVAFADANITCIGDGSASVTFSYTITSNSADAASLTGQIDGDDVFQLPGVASGSGDGGWIIGGQAKTADRAYTTTLVNGQHTFTVCATQSGGEHNPDKHACESQTIVIDCPVTDRCSNTEVFGEVPHNKNLCKASGHIEIQFRGNFGDTAILEIEGPTGFYFSPLEGVAQAGDSCNYHYNWNPRPATDTADPGTGNGGPGVYTFTVNGNDQNPLVFSATLECQLPPGKPK